MRALRLVLSVLLALLVLAGCGSYGARLTAPGGSGGDAGYMAVRDARFTANPSADGDEAYPAGADAPLTLTIVNTGDATDTLRAVTSPVAAGSDVAGDAQVLGGFTLVSGSPDPVREQAAVFTTIRLTDLAAPLRAGLTYPVTFTFERSGSVTLDVPVGNPS